MTESLNIHGRKSENIDIHSKIGSNMETAVHIPRGLVQRISDAAREDGFRTVDAFVASALEEKLLRMQTRKRFFETSDQVRSAMAARGVTEDQIIDDFEAFRERLYRERQ